MSWITSNLLGEANKVSYKKGQEACGSLNYPVLCEVFKLVGTVAACSGILPVFTQVPPCQPYLRPNPASFQHCCPSVAHTRIDKLLSSAIKSQSGTAGTSGLAPPLNGISCLSAAPLPRDSNFLHNRYVLEEILCLSSCCLQPQPVLAWTSVITLPTLWQRQHR